MFDVSKKHEPQQFDFIREKSLQIQGSRFIVWREKK